MVFEEIGFADLKHGEGCGQVDAFVQLIDFGVDFHRQRGGLMSPACNL